MRSTGYLVKYNYDSVLRKNKNKKESNISQSSEKYTACESPSPQGRRQSRNKKKQMIIKYCFFSSPFNLSLFLTIFDLSSFFFRLRKSKLLFHVDEFSLGTIQLLYEETKNQTY